MKGLLVDEIAAAIRTRPAPVGSASLAETILEEVFPSDGCAVEGVFYPFMVDCPSTFHSPGNFGGTCMECGGMAGQPGKVRNPTLIWEYLGRPGCHVAVGVKS